MTLNDLIPKFLKQYRGGTRTFYEGSLRSFAEVRGSTALMALRPYHVTEWLDTWESISSTYRCNLVRAVKRALKWAEEQGYIASSPLAKMPIPRQVARGDEMYLTPEQVTALLEGEGDLCDILTFLRDTGCRPEEARKLEARHVGECITFGKDDSKGRRQQRVVHLTDRARSICERRSAAFPEGPIFRDRGRPWTSVQLSAATRRRGKQLGFEVSPYSLRHTFATQAIMNGCDLLSVAALMGHTSLKMLQEVYAHVSKRSTHLKSTLERATAC